MPDIRGPGEEQPGKRRFIREKIVKQPMSKREMVKRGVVFLAAAVLFGAVAAVTFVVSKPLAEKYLVQETETEGVPITIPKDEPETTVPVTEPETTRPEETEPIEDMLKAALAEYEFSIDDLNSLHANLKSVSQQADKGIVTVHSVKEETDWFDNPVETTDLYAGAVIASGNGELLILTPDGAIEEADSIKVAFADGTEAVGSIKQKDVISGMAIVSVPLINLEKSVLDSVEPVVLGNSYAVKQGDLVIAVGSPAGVVHSTTFGTISYITRNVQVTDGITRIIHSDLKSNARTGTFLLNTSGQMIGWVTDAYKNDGGPDMTLAMSISEYKSSLEKMNNGDSVPYFGIKGQEVSAALNETGIPLGVYVTECIAESPAYDAGIQSGDIITQIDGKDIVTMKDFQTKLDSLKIEENVTVTVQRNGREEYKELEYQVTIRAR